MANLKKWMQRQGIGKAQIILFTLTFLLLSFSIGSSIYKGIINTYTINDVPVTIYVGDKATINSVAGQLGSENVMNPNRFIFYTQIYTDWNVYIKKVFEGTYTIPPNTHVKDVLKILKLKE